MNAILAVRRIGGGEYDCDPVLEGRCPCAAPPPGTGDRQRAKPALTAGRATPYRSRAGRRSNVAFYDVFAPTGTRSDRDKLTDRPDKGSTRRRCARGRKVPAQDIAETKGAERRRCRECDGITKSRGDADLKAAGRKDADRSVTDDSSAADDIGPGADGTSAATGSNLRSTAPSGWCRRFELVAATSGELTARDRFRQSAI